MKYIGLVTRKYKPDSGLGFSLRKSLSMHFKLVPVPSWLRSDLDLVSNLIEFVFSLEESTKYQLRTNLICLRFSLSLVLV